MLTTVGSLASSLDEMWDRMMALEGVHPSVLALNAVWLKLQAATRDSCGFGQVAA